MAQGFSPSLQCDAPYSSLQSLWWPSQIVDISVAASILNVIISNFSCFQIVLSLRNLNCSDKLKHIRYQHNGGTWYKEITPKVMFSLFLPPVLILLSKISLWRDWNKTITCNRSPFHLDAVRMDLELSRQTFKIFIFIIYIYYYKQNFLLKPGHQIPLRLIKL